MKIAPEMDISQSETEESIKNYLTLLVQSGCYKINLALLTATLNISDIHTYILTKIKYNAQITRFRIRKMPKLKIL